MNEQNELTRTERAPFELGTLADLPGESASEAADRQLSSEADAVPPQSASDDSLSSANRFLTDLQIVSGISFIPLEPADNSTEDEIEEGSSQSPTRTPSADRLLLDNLFGSFFNELSPFQIQETKQGEPGTSGDGTTIQERPETTSQNSNEGTDTLPDTIFAEGDGSGAPDTIKLAEARQSLLESGKRNGISGEQLERLVGEFESGIKDRRDRGLEAPGDEEIAQTFKNLQEMIEGKAEEGGLDSESRKELATTTLYNLAHPEKIDQGQHLGNITTVEIYTASRHPENYSRLLKEVALTGSFKTAAGENVEVPQEAIAKGSEQTQFSPDSVGENRWNNWASKIFQETGINSVLPILQPDQAHPTWGKPHTEGPADMVLPHIQAACDKINGEQMAYFGVADVPTAKELLALKERGEFPVGVHTFHYTGADGRVSANHVQTIQDVRMKDGKLQVLLDDQRGDEQDSGWTSLESLHQRQNYNNLPSEWYDIPSQYRGKDFDRLPLNPEDSDKVDPEGETDRIEPTDDTSPHVLESRRKLEEALCEGLSGPFKHKKEEKVHELLDKFEERCGQDRDSGLTAPSEEQIAKAYQSALRTLENPRSVLTPETRQKLVLEGLRNIGEPLGIDQGDHGTCGNTCAEKFIAVRHPDIYMEALKQVAENGTYTTPDGRVLRLPQNDVRQGPLGNRMMTWQRGYTPDTEAQNWDVFKETGFHPLHPNENKRNYASQIMQNLNLADALESARLGQGQAPGVVDSLSFLEVERFTKRMTGTPMTTVNQFIQTEGNIMKPLDDSLALQLKQDGRFPAMVYRAYHWQTIHDARTATVTDQYGRSRQVVQVLSDNQWGKSRDRGWVTIPQLRQELAEAP